MTFTLNAEVAAVLAAAIEQNGPPPTAPVGDVASRRVALDAMLGYFNNQAQPPAGPAHDNAFTRKPRRVAKLIPGNRHVHIGTLLSLIHI